MNPLAALFCTRGVDDVETSASSSCETSSVLSSVQSLEMYSGGMNVYIAQLAMKEAELSLASVAGFQPTLLPLLLSMTVFPYWAASCRVHFGCTELKVVSDIETLFIKLTTVIFWPLYCQYKIWLQAAQKRWKSTPIQRQSRVESLHLLHSLCFILR